MKIYRAWAARCSSNFAFGRGLSARINRSAIVRDADHLIEALTRPKKIKLDPLSPFFVMAIPH
jgi:hypothetical protein